MTSIPEAFLVSLPPSFTPPPKGNGLLIRRAVLSAFERYTHGITQYVLFYVFSHVTSWCHPCH